MSLVAIDEEQTAERIHIPSDIDWQMLDKSRFFILGAALFSGVSTILYPVVVLKTRQQVSRSHVSCINTAASIKNHEGLRGLYRGLGTSLVGTIPARALYMTALEVTKSNVAVTATRLGISEPTASAAANATAGLSAATAAQLVWTPVDVISQRLMAQGNANKRGFKYANGIDAFNKIIKLDGIRGLYRGFGISILTYAPSNAVWWASYSIFQRMIWGRTESFSCNKELQSLENGVRNDHKNMNDSSNVANNGLRSDSKAVVMVQGISAAMAGGLSAFVTMPLDTIKTRLQVLDRDDNGKKRPSFGQTMRSLVKEGGWAACYRGLGPRCATMSVSATTMITTYEFLKRLSAKNQQVMAS